MPWKTRIIGSNGGPESVEAGIFNPKKFGREGSSGLISYTEPLYETVGAALPLSDENGSTNLAVDASFSGTPETVYDDDPTTNWTNSALSGTWDFASTAVTPASGTEVIDATSTINGDQAQMERSSAVDLSSYTALTGQIYISTWNDNRHSVSIEIRTSGVLQGNAVLISDYVDTTITGQFQQFAIPKSDLGLNGQSIDQVVITTNSTAGQPPDYYLDLIQFQESGLKEFSVTLNPGQKFQVLSVNYAILDNVTVVEPDSFLGAGNLANGIIIRTQRQGGTAFLRGVKGIADVAAAGGQIGTIVTGTTDTFVPIIGDAPGGTILRGDDGDNFSFLIQDDLSAITSFRVSLRGRLFT